MSSGKHRKLKSTVATLQRRFGERALQKGAIKPTIPSHIQTSFTELDTLTGCQGIPVGMLTVLSGRMTSGKLTIAYKILMNAQTGGQAVALLDLNGSSDADYMERCGINLETLFWIRPTPETQVVQLLIDLLQTRQLRLLLIDSLPDLLNHSVGKNQLYPMLDQLLNVLRRSHCALICLDEYAPVWLRLFRLNDSWLLHQQAALHIELRHERWLYEKSKLIGYEAQAHLLKSRWERTGRKSQLAIIFNGTIRAGTTW